MNKLSASREPIDNNYVRSPLSKAKLDMEQVCRPFFQRKNPRTALVDNHFHNTNKIGYPSIGQRRSRSKDYLITHDSGVSSNRYANKENQQSNTSLHKFQTTNNAYGNYTYSEKNLADTNAPIQRLNRPPRAQSRDYQSSGNVVHQKNNLFAHRVPSRMAQNKQSESPTPNRKEFFCMESRSRTRDNLSVTKNDCSLSREPISIYSSGEKRNIQLIDLNMQKEIGKGSYAVVKLGIHRESKEQFAVKTYEKVKLNDPLKQKSVDREILILQKMSHPSIIKYVNHLDTRQ